MENLEENKLENNNVEKGNKSKKFNIKKPLLFTVALSPVSIVASLLVGIYGYGSYSEEVQQQILEQSGNYSIFLLGASIQGLIIASLCAFFGYILAEKVGLIKTFRFEKNKFIKALIITIIGGIIFSLDYWTFGNILPEIQEAIKEGQTVIGFFASVLYGGIIEEILLRLFFMSLIAFILWKILFRKNAKEQIPYGVFIVANVLAAVIFAAGHLPATINIFGSLTPLLIFRCFLLNGSFGIVFGWLYQKYGIQYAMLGHMGFHIISKVIWLILV